MDGIDAYVLAKNIAISAVSGVKNYTVDGTTLKIETNDGNILDMTFPVPTGIESGYYNDENGKFYRDPEFENEITGKTDVVYIDHGQNRLCFWDGAEFTTTKKNALEFTAEEKAKLERLRNYDDSVLSGKINNVEKVIPSNASVSNKLATIADIENKNDGTTNYNDLENKPKIAGIELSGNKTLTDLGIQPAITGKGLSTEDFTTEEKTKLSSLSNYNDSSIKGELANIKNIIPSNANSENKLATLADIPSGGSGNEGGTTNYSELTNKPQIAGVTLSGNKTLTELGIQGAEEGKGLSTNDFSNEDKDKLDNLSNYDDTSLKGRMSNIENKIPSKASNSNKLATMADIPSVPEIPEVITDYSDLSNKPQIGGVTLDGNKNLADLGIQAVEEGKGLSTEDFTTEEKNKLAELVNYNDSELDTRVSSIEEVMPTSATPSNPLATLADIPSNVSGGSSTPTNYATLSNKPQIAGIELTGNKTLANLGIQPSEEGKGLSTNDFSDEEKSKLAGLSNYDDTALDNRVSNVENALSDKVDKDGSKGLSTNDFSNEDKAKLDGLSNYDDSILVGRINDLEDDLSNKVNKDGDKVLSTNDFTNAYKSKLDELSNYDDTTLNERLSDIENIVPENANGSNKLATVNDIPTVPEPITDYSDLNNKPQIAGVSLVGNKTLANLGIQSAEEGKGLSTEDYTSEEKSKLAKIAENADVNIIESITVNGTKITPDENKNVAFTVMTNSVNDLLNYYLKSETYTKEEVNALINAIKTVTFEAVNVLPTTDIKTNVIYLVPKTSSKDKNAKDEYINLDGTTEGWELIGDTAVDLTGYVTTSMLNTVLADYTTTENLTVLLDNKVDKVEGKGLSTNDYTDEDKEKLNSLSNYDDTSLNNRVTTIENTLSNKVDEVEGKGLSTNDYTDIEKTKLESLSNYDDTLLSGRVTTIENTLDNKVNKVEGKSLSTEDYTTEEKTKLAGLTNYDDTSLSNRVATIENTLSDKVDKDGDKVLSTNDYTDAEKTKLAGLSNYDDTGINSRVQGLEDIIPESVNSENRLATMEDIDNIPIITPSDIDRLWEATFEDGDKEEY